MEKYTNVNKINILHIVFILILMVIALPSGPLKTLEKSGRPKKMAKKDRIEWAIRQEFDATRDPVTGLVPSGKLYDIYQDISRQMFASPRSVSPIAWQERGPVNVAGRTRSVLIDASDPTGNKVLVGSVSGGIWKSVNAKSASPNWTHTSGMMDNLAIGCLVQHPTNPSLIYAGTGEGFFNVDAVKGNGIWKSSNGGNSWVRLPSTANANFDYTTDIGINSSGHLFACTRNNGVMRSTNGGSSWTKVLGESLGALSDKASDIFIASDGTIFVSMGLFETDGIYRSNDNGSSWVKLTEGLPPYGYQRIEIAGTPQNPDLIYALFQDEYSGGCLGLFKSSDQGDTWSSLNLPSAYGMSNFARNQAWYNLAIAIDPDNSNRLIVGGIDLHKSENGGLNWTQISQWAGMGNYPYIHADQHQIVFQGNNSSTVFFGNDGGIARCTNIGASSPQMLTINTGYNVTQFYGAAIHPVGASPLIIAGAQDNGTQLFDQPGAQATQEIAGGDGSFCHIDQDNPNVQIATYVFNNYYISTDGGQHFTLKSFNNSGRFANPSVYDKSSQKLYAGNWAGSYFRWNNPAQSGSQTDGVTVTAFGDASVSAVGLSPNVANRVYFGLDNGKVIRVDDADTGSSKSGVTVLNATGGYVSSIAIEKGNENHLLVSFSNYGIQSVKESANGGLHWTDVEGNLPDFPVRCCVFDPINSDRAVLGTELGIWRTDNLNGTGTVWYNESNALSSVRVDQLVFRASDNYLAAATHGRGLFTSSSFVLPKVNFDESLVVVNEKSMVGSFGNCHLNYQTLNIPVKISTAPPTTVTVQFSIEGGSTAVSGKDFILLTPSITFTPTGSLQQQIQVRILDEAILEGDEMLGIRITGNPDYIGDQNLVQVEIQDDDFDPTNPVGGQITIGNGSGSTYEFPFGGYYEDERTQILYRQEELIAAGLSAGMLDQLAFFITNKQSNAPFENLNIKLKQVNLDQFSGQGSAFTVGAEPVFYGDVNTVPGWNIFDFSQAFYWNGSSDLVVDICFNNTDWSDDDFVRTTPTAYNSVQFTAGDGSNGCSFSIVGAVSHQRPDIRFTRGGSLLLADQPCSKTSMVSQGDVAHFYAAGKLIASIQNLDGGSIDCAEMQLDGVGSGINHPAWMEGAGVTQKSFFIDADVPAPYQISLYFHPSELAAWEKPTGLHMIKTNGPVSGSDADGYQILFNEDLDVEILPDGIIVYRGIFNDFSGFALTNLDPSTLPVELLHFNVEKQVAGNLLRWGYPETFSFASVTIEKSNDDSGQFMEIARLDRDEALEMVFKDDSIEPGFTYYRLKFEDLQGFTDYSALRSVWWDARSMIDCAISIYPNPACENLVVENFSPAPGPQAFFITDQNFSVIKRYEFARDTWKRQLDLSGLAQGIYLLYEQQGAETNFVGRFMKLESP